MADASSTLERGTLLLQAGNAAAALPFLREAMRELPGEPRAAFRVGTATFQLGDHAAAASAFAKATELAPAWVEAWNNLAAAQARLPDLAAAIVSARHALQLSPQRLASQQTLAALLSNQFDRDSIAEGRRLISSVLHQGAADAQAQLTAAILWRKSGDLTRAENHARNAVALAPGDTQIVEALGEILLLLRRPDAAVQAYRDAIDRGNGSPAIQRQLGVALLQLGQAGPAVQRLAGALRAAPGDQRALAHLGAALALSGHVQHAEQLLGLQRNVHALRLPPPPAFASDEAFRAELAEDIRNHSLQRWEPAGLAARAAYLSGDLLADRTPAIVGFEQCLLSGIDRFIASRHRDDNDAFLRSIPRRYRLHMWATQAAQGGHIDTHIHEESWLSGAYYVQLPDAIAQDDATHAGWIEFGRPYQGLPPVPEASLRLICPQVGVLLLFPSFLFHRTLPYTGPGERISISFDLAAA